MKEVVFMLILAFTTGSFCYAGFFDTIADVANKALSTSSEDNQSASRANNASPQPVSEGNMVEGKPISAQFKDFKWGMDFAYAKRMIINEGKVESRYAPKLSEQLGPLYFRDTMFDSTIEVSLFFTTTSHKLYRVTVNITYGENNKVYQAVLESLSKKYGPGVNKSSSGEERYHWGNASSGDSINVYPDSGYFVLDYWSGEFNRLQSNEKNAIKEEGDQKIKDDASKL